MNDKPLPRLRVFDLPPAAIMTRPRRLLLVITAILLAAVTVLAIVLLATDVRP